MWLTNSSHNSPFSSIPRLVALAMLPFRYARILELR